MKKIKITSLLIALFLITGCVSFKPTVPEHYTGAVATIKDSAKIHSTSKVDFFYLSKLDQNAVYNSRFKTMDANYGNGFYMKPVIASHKIPANKKCTIEIVGRTEYAAPILALSNTVYQIKGEITFVPKPNKHYIVKGSLSEKYSTVWIQDLSSGRVIGHKIRINGSAELSFLQK